MNDLRNIDYVLASLVELLEDFEANNWANALQRCRRELSTEPAVVANRILSMYGGTGSLNDLVLYKNGKPLMGENNELDTLRTELYSLCRSIE